MSIYLFLINVSQGVVVSSDLPTIVVAVTIATSSNVKQHATNINMFQ